VKQWIVIYLKNALLLRQFFGEGKTISNEKGQNKKRNKNNSHY
jgi:hypothetical protein